MDTVKTGFLLTLCLALCGSSGNARAQENSPHSLYAQAAIKILERDFPKTDSSYLLLDARTGAILAHRWEDVDRPISLGSLVKPFTALAYASGHNFVYPKLECKGKASSCWEVKPHGVLDLTSAISMSCNAYFRQLASSISADQINQIARNFGIELPAQKFESQTLAGLGDLWRISPLNIAKAYLELQRRKEQPGVKEIIEGMRQSALHGTGLSIGRQLVHTKALVKTGTAPCTHIHWAPADGFTMVMIPAGDPEILLMIREHSVTGATTAELAGKLLHEME
jgi:cell division protein FtsI/penicillin-binding protein 2